MTDPDRSTATPPRPVSNQSALPGVTGHDSAGQIELHHPGARLRERPADHESVAQLDPAQGSLPHVPGVRRSMRPWRRDSDDRSAAIPWTQLELSLSGLSKHAARDWTENDHATMQAIRAQTWNVTDINQANPTIPIWLTVDELISPSSGEVIQITASRTTTKRPRTMPHTPRVLGIVWAAYAAATGGVYASKIGWASMLGIHPRTVSRLFARLEDAGLLRLVRTYAPPEAGRARDHWFIARIGPVLESLAGLSAFAEKRHRAPGVDRVGASHLAVALRQAARDRSYYLQGVYWNRNREQREATPARPRAPRPAAPLAPRIPARMRRREPGRGAPPAGVVPPVESGSAPDRAESGERAERVSFDGDGNPPGPATRTNSLPTPLPPSSGREGIASERPALPSPSNETRSARSPLSARSGAEPDSTGGTTPAGGGKSERGRRAAGESVKIPRGSASRADDLAAKLARWGLDATEIATFATPPPLTRPCSDCGGLKLRPDREGPCEYCDGSGEHRPDTAAKTDARAARIYAAFQIEARDKRRRRRGRRS